MRRKLRKHLSEMPSLIPLSRVASVPSSPRQIEPELPGDLEETIVDIPEDWDLEQANLDLLACMKESTTNQTPMHSPSSSSIIKEDLYLSLSSLDGDNAPAINPAILSKLYGGQRAN